jgi:hypothetical protein
MAGRGPAPKDPSRRAGKAKDPNPTTSIRFERAEQPPLPDDVDWHPQTRRWWQMWAETPQAEHFMASDWDFLLDTAVLHSAYWQKGQWTLAAEIRLRVAKVGATPEDRQRLRYQMAVADEKDAQRSTAPTGTSSRKRYGVLTSLPPAASE